MESTHKPIREELPDGRVGVSTAWCRSACAALVVAACGLPALSWGASLTGSAAEAAEPRHALVIGNSRYREVSTLANVANDLTDMCRALQDLRFHTTCVADLATREDFLNAVRAYVRSVPAGASAVLHYSGHAVQVAGENYLIPTAVTLSGKQDWLSQFVPLSELFRIVEQAGAGFQLIVLDACRDNPEEDDASQAGAAGRSAAKRPAGQKLDRAALQLAANNQQARNNLRNLLAKVRSATGRFVGYGIAAVRDAPSNTLVLFATGAGTSAFDGDGERNGPLTKHLLIQMQRPQLTIDDAVKAIIQGVGDDTEERYQRRQSPSLYGTFAGEFCFNGCPEILSPEEIAAERERAAQAERERAAAEEKQWRRKTLVVPAM